MVIGDLLGAVRFPLSCDGFPIVLEIASHIHLLLSSSLKYIIIDIVFFATSYFGGMASLKLHDIVKQFDGGQDVVQWINKFERVTSLRKIEDLENVLPLFLEGPAYDVYSEMDESKKMVYADIKNKLLQAFSTDRFTAFEMFSSLKWSGEPADVYMSALRKLAKLASIENQEVLKNAFVVGMPRSISRELRTMENIKSVGLDTVIDRARILISEESGSCTTMVSRSVRSSKLYTAERKANSGCYQCGGPHFARNCNIASRKERREIQCFHCGGPHMIKNCPQNSSRTEGLGNDGGRSGAPAALPAPIDQ